MRLKHFRPSLISAVLVAATVPGTVTAQTPDATPYRPGVGSPAVVSAKGYFEIEAGLDRARAGGLTGDGLGVLLKYGVTDNLGLMLGASPWRRSSGLGTSTTGAGDLAFGAKWVSKLNDNIALGAQWVSTAPVGSAAFKGPGNTDTATALVGLDFAGFHSDLNLGFTHDSKGTAGVSRSHLNWSASLGRVISGPFSGAVEISGSRQSGAGSIKQLLGSVSYTVNKQLVLDAYIARARNTPVGASSSNGNALGLGMTYLIGK
jgi:hypothetical protein